MLWEDGQLVSVANLTRQDGIDFLRPAPKFGIVTKTNRYPLNEANQALAGLRAGPFEGAAVLVLEYGLSRFNCASSAALAIPGGVGLSSFRAYLRRIAAG